MTKISIFIIIVFILTSCGFFGEKVNFFKGIDFNDKADWILVKSNSDTETYGIISDKELLLKFNRDLKIKLTSECGGTTSDNNIALYKNGKLIKSVSYCSWEPLSYDLGELNKHFKPSSLKMVKAKSINRHNFILDSLKQLDNVYLIYPKDTLINFPNQLKFEIKLVNKGQDIFKQERPIEDKFKCIFPEIKYQVKADFYLSEVGSPRKLGYKITVDCDTSFLKHFDKSLLKQSELFQEMNECRYLTKEFKIRYYQWTK